jgi:hypothetical protein
LSDLRNSSDCDPIYEACIFAIYLCTYKLSTSIWASCYIPERCVDQIIRCVGEAVHNVRSVASSELLLWLMVICGGLTERRQVRIQVKVLIHNELCSYLGDFIRGWQASKEIMQRHIWCACAMESKVTSFWSELSQTCEEPVKG